MVCQGRQSAGWQSPALPVGRAPSSLQAGPERHAYQKRGSFRVEPRSRRARPTSRTAEMVPTFDGFAVRPLSFLPKLFRGISTGATSPPYTDVSHFRGRVRRLSVGRGRWEADAARVERRQGRGDGGGRGNGRGVLARCCEKSWVFSERGDKGEELEGERTKKRGRGTTKARVTYARS